MHGTSVVKVRNVNFALSELLHSNKLAWRKVCPRGIETIEHPGPMITEYACPQERVSFSAARDANPFFHFFESLWILAGSGDVEFLAQFNSEISKFSDNGTTFHAPYGYRLRVATNMDQLEECVSILTNDPDSRQAVATIWDADKDLNVRSKDIPCNDMLFFKIRDGALHTTVLCRSNDALLGAYGANVVQFSMIHEFMARALHVGIGPYVQYSDSFHIYTDSSVWKRMLETKHRPEYEDADCPYAQGLVRPYPIMEAGKRYREWLAECTYYVRTNGLQMRSNTDKFFSHVADPMFAAWKFYKHGADDKQDRIDGALNILQKCDAEDWRLACTEWLMRRSPCRQL